MEDEAVDANLLISGDTDFLYEALLIPQGAQCGKQPAIPISALANVICSSALDEKLRVVENIGDSLDRPRAETNVGVVFRGGCKSSEAIFFPIPSFQIKLKVEMLVGIFLVDSTTFFNNFIHLISAKPCCFFVG